MSAVLFDIVHCLEFSNESFSFRAKMSRPRIEVIPEDPLERRLKHCNVLLVHHLILSLESSA